MDRKPVGSPTPVQSPLPAYQRQQSLPEQYPSKDVALQEQQQSQPNYDQRSYSTPIPTQQTFNGQPQYIMQQGYPPNEVVYMQSPGGLVDAKGHPQGQIVYVQAPGPAHQAKGGVIYLQAPNTGQQQPVVVVQQQQKGRGGTAAAAAAGGAAGGAAGACCGACGACAACLCCCTVM